MHRLISAAVAIAATAATLATMPLAAYGAPPAPTARASASAEPRPEAIVRPVSFSPNNDGVRDSAVIRFHLPRWGDDVTLTIGHPSKRQVLRTVELGRLWKGTHTWTWDGRRGNGRLVSDGSYRVTVRARANRWDGGIGRVQVDRTFSPELFLGDPYLASLDRPAAVYPRTTDVRDSVTLTTLPANVYDIGANTIEDYEDLFLVIRNPAGRVVLREPMAPPSEEGPDFSYDWTARVKGKALPPGRYRAAIDGRDQAGNPGPSEPVRLWVSRERLEWTQVARTVQPDGSEIGSCFFDGGSGCADAEYYNPSCGTVTPSQLFAGGLSYRSSSCAAGQTGTTHTGRSHWLPFLDAVPGRGVSSARVAFSGAPTNAGETDAGTVMVWSSDYYTNSSATSSTGAETSDVQPEYGSGLSDDHTGTGEPIPPGVAWSFSTRDGNWVDVRDFTVMARYLTVAD